MKPLNMMFVALLTLGLFFSSRATCAEVVTPETLESYSLNLIQQAEKKIPNYGETYFAQGNVLFQAKKYDASIKAYTKGLSLSKPKAQHAEIMKMIASNYTKLNNDEKAITWYHKAVKCNPKQVVINHHLGMALQRLNLLEEASKAYEAEVKLDPTHGAALVHLGECYMALDRLDDVIPLAKQAMKAKPLYPEPYYLLAKVYRKQKKVNEANLQLDLFRKKKIEETAYIDNLPKGTSQDQAISRAVQTHLDLASIYYQKRHDKECEALLRGAIRLDRRNEDARFRLAKLALEQGNHESASSYYHELLALNKKEYRYHLGIGFIYANQKRWDEALRYLGTAHKLFPENPTVKRGFAQALISSKRDPEKALVLLKELVVIQPTADNMNILSSAYFANGDMDQTIKTLQQAMTLEPDNPRIKRTYELLMKRLNR